MWQKPTRSGGANCLRLPGRLWPLPLWQKHLFFEDETAGETTWHWGS